MLILLTRFLSCNILAKDLQDPTPTPTPNETHIQHRDMKTKLCENIIDTT